MTHYRCHHSGCLLGLVLLGWLVYALGVAVLCVLVVLAWLAWGAMPSPPPGRPGCADDRSWPEGWSGWRSRTLAGWARAKSPNSKREARCRTAPGFCVCLMVSSESALIATAVRYEAQTNGRCQWHAPIALSGRVTEVLSFPRVTLLKCANWTCSGERFPAIAD